MAPNLEEIGRSLTPSERLFLNGDQFVGKAMLGNVKLLRGDTAVSASELGNQLLLVALLTAVEAGELRLELRETKALFGLRRNKVPVVVPSEGSKNWPEGSLEATLCNAARAKAVDGQCDVYSLVYHWFGGDCGVPGQVVAERLQAGMAVRGLLEVHEEKKLGLFSHNRYSLSDQISTFGDLQSVEQIRQLLGRWRSEQPELLSLLEKRIQKAVRARTDQD